MKRLIAPLSVALLITLSGCGIGAKPNRVEGARAGSSSTTETSTESTEPGKGSFGEAVQVTTDPGTKLELTIGRPADLDPAQAEFPPEKGKYVVVDAKAKLVKGIVGNVSEDEFTLVDANGGRYEPAIASTELTGSFIHLLTDDGETANGKIVYDVPSDATGFHMEYKPTDSDSRSLGLLASWS